MIIEQNIKYGTFQIKEGIGYWNQDHGVQVKMVDSPSKACQLEGYWNPSGKRLQTNYPVAMAGLCIWAKHDCVVKFEARGKGNQGAERSFINPRDRLEVLERLEKGHKLEQIFICNPFGSYQSKMIAWQVDTVRRFGVQKLYYALPVEEYRQKLHQVSLFLPPKCLMQFMEILNSHYQQLEQEIKNRIEAEIVFVHPLKHNNSISIEESYVWPYQNLQIDLGIEEMEEVRIPYQAMKLGVAVPPILLGMLGTPRPYYERRDYHSESDFQVLYL